MSAADGSDASEETDSLERLGRFAWKPDASYHAAVRAWLIAYGALVPCERRPPAEIAIMSCGGSPTPAFVSSLPVLTIASGRLP